MAVSTVGPRAEAAGRSERGRRQKVWHVVFFYVFTALFTWPVLSIVNRTGTVVPFLYLFSAWILLIVLLIITTRGPGRGDNGV